MGQIIRLNLPDVNSYILEKELSKITVLDQCDEFRFVVKFIGAANTGLNNFVCKVYPKCGEDEDRLLGTLQRGEEGKMRYLIKAYHEEF